MFRVFVCDDEESFHKDIGSILEEYLSKTVKRFEIFYFLTPDELLQANYEQCDVFCLDMVLGDHMNGIELARMIRQKNYKAFIIFTSFYTEIPNSAFEVNAFRYFLKPIRKEQLKGAFDIILKKRREQNAKIITLQLGQRYFRIPYSEILYFETEERKLHTVTVGKDYLTDDKINELDKQAEDANFFRIHKSYLINLAFVREYDQKSVTMLNGDILFISRLRLKDFKTNYQRYLIDEHMLR